MQESYLTKLETVLLIISLKKKPEKSQKEMSMEYVCSQRRWEYACDISRTIEQLKLTVILMENLPTTDVLQKYEKNQEELILYYQGVLLDLVHQLKNKIFQLVNLLTQKDTVMNPKKEHDVSLSDLIKKKGEVIGKIGIKDLLEAWSEDESFKGPIGVVLQKRSIHHHRVSTLHYNYPFQKIKFLRTVDSNFQEMLSDYGKKEVGRLTQVEFEEYKKDALRKMRNSMSEIQTNIEKVAESLLAYFQFPTSLEEIKKLSLSCLE